MLLIGQTVTLVTAVFAVANVKLCQAIFQQETTFNNNSNSNNFKCPEKFGYFPDPFDCSKYFVCVFGDPLHESCTGGLFFSVDHQTCDWPRNTPCQQGKYFNLFFTLFKVIQM